MRGRLIIRRIAKQKHLGIVAQHRLDERIIRGRSITQERLAHLGLTHRRKPRLGEGADVDPNSERVRLDLHLGEQRRHRHGLEPQVRMELSTNEAIKQAIIAGLGVSIMSRYTLGLDVSHEQLAVLDVEGFPVERHWVFAYPVGKQLSAVAQSFMEFTRKTAKSLIFDHLSST